MDDEKVIYTICTIENLGNYITPYSDEMLADRKKYYREKQKTRTPGFFFDLKTAQECVEENGGDIYEGSYTHVVIEKMGEGLYGGSHIGEDAWWYQWEGDWDTGKYIPIEKEKLKEVYKDIMSTCNWGLG